MRNSTVLLIPPVISELNECAWSFIIEPDADDKWWEFLDSEVMFLSICVSLPLEGIVNN